MQNENFSDTKVSLTLGSETYLLNFGITTQRRLHEMSPGFTIFSETMPSFQIVPTLILAAIPVEKRKWTTQDEFDELYDEASQNNPDALALIPLAYQNALGFIDRQFIPAYGRLAEAIQVAEKADEELKAKKDKKE